MSTRKKKQMKPKVKNKGENVYIGDLNIFEDIDHQKNLPWHQEVRINHLERRLSILERALGPANIIKATPAIALFYTDMNCKKRVRIIYENWIRFMGYISQQKNGWTIENVFWALDGFIFESFFTQKSRQKELQVFIVPLNDNDTFTQSDIENINRCLTPDRDNNHKLKKPSDKEFISTLVSGKQVFLMYYPDEILQQQQQQQQPPPLPPVPQAGDTSSSPDSIKNPVQLRSVLHPELSLNKSVVSEIDSSSIGIKSNNNLRLGTSSPASLDKRLIILGSQRPLYNSIVDTNQVERYQENLFSMGQPSLRLALMVHHAMIHIMTDISSAEEFSTNRRHSNDFLEQFVNYTPSVLFGHYMFPALTIADNTS